MTFDLDLVVELADSNMRGLVTVLESAGYVSRLPVPLLALADQAQRDVWTEQRNLIAFSLHHPQRPMEEVDIILRVTEPWKTIEQSVVWRSVGEVRFPVVGRSLLRQMKLAAGRSKDLADAALLGDDDE